MTCHPAASLETHLSLIDKTNCQYLLHPAPGFPKAKSILSSQPHIKALLTPPLSFWLSDTGTNVPVHPYPYLNSLPEILTHPFAAIHTSATTSTAKPIFLTHASLNQQALLYLGASTPEAVNFSHWRDQRVAYLAPLTIAAGFFTLLAINLVYNITVVLPVSESSPTNAEVLDGVITHGNISAAILSPKHLRDTCARPSYLARLQTLSHLVIVGAPCPTDVGEILTHHVNLTYMYGSSEANVFPIHVTKDPEDWGYMTLDGVLPHTFRHVWADLHELVLLRDETRNIGQSVFYMFPSLSEYGMKDLFRRHPDPQKADLWMYCGRVEDLTESESQGQFMPRCMEGVLETCRGVKGVVVCEERRGGMPVLVEVDESLLVVGSGDEMGQMERREALLSRVWPWVDHANNISPVKGCIRRSGVIFVDRKRPLPRGVKGYPQRSASKALYRREIEDAYRTFG